MVKRVALVGSSSTGKSTVFELLKNKLPKWEFINESTRNVASYGFPINEEGTNETQLAISSFHLQALLQPYNLILDRCYLDLLVYSDGVDAIDDKTYTYIHDIWKKIKNEYTHFIYFPIEFDAVDDGQRSINEKWRRRIDDLFIHYLGFYDLNYLEVTGSPMQRLTQILNYIQE